MRDLRQQPMTANGELQSPMTGRVLSDTEVSAYNRYTMDFNRLTYTAAKEFMLDQRHKFVMNCFYQ